MNKFTVTLKQHTPLIHFQHDQEGATLRASEVKPKLDKYLIKHVFNNKKEEYKKYLIGNGDHPALDYKLEIRAYDAKNLKIIETEEIKKRVLPKSPCGEQLYSTMNYPDNDNSLLMSNMGGRIKSEIANFSLSDKVELIFRSRNLELRDLIKENIGEFVSSRNFGQRTSKGFGSFEVTHINKDKIGTPEVPCQYSVTFTIKDVKNEESGFKDLFKLISFSWYKLKRENETIKGSDIRRVLLGVPFKNEKPERIPSPVMFKPIIDKYRGDWEVYLYIILDEEVIQKALGDNGENRIIKKIDYALALVSVKEAAKLLCDILKINLTDLVLEKITGDSE